MGECVICLTDDPPPVQSGCACRGDAGLAHAACLIRKAIARANAAAPQPQKVAALTSTLAIGIGSWL